MITSPKFYKFAQILTVLVFPTAVAGLWFIQVEDMVRVSGVVASSQQETITSPCKDTIIDSVFVENGDLVEPGQPLVLLKDLHGRQSMVERVKNKMGQLKESLTALTPEAEKPAPRCVILQSRNAELNALETLLKTLEEPSSFELTKPTPTTYHAEIRRLKQQETHLRDDLAHTRKMVAQGLSPEKKLDNLTYQIEQVSTERRRAELTLSEKLTQTQKERVTSRHQLSQIRAEIESERNRLTHEMAEAELTLKELKRELDRLLITAPFYGRVVDVPAKVYQPVNVGTPLVKLSGNEPKIITCRVPESRILEVKPNQTVVIKSNLYNFLKHDVYHGVVQHIAPHGIQEDTRVFYEVTIAVHEGHDILKVGSAAGCEILVGSNPAIFLLIGRH